MGEHLQNKTGTREFFTIVYFLLALKVSDNTPTILFQVAKNAGWMLPLISGVTVLIPLLAIFRLVKKYEKGLVDIMFMVLGRPITLIIGTCMCALIIINTGINTRSYVDIMQSLYLPRTPQLAVYGILIFSSYFLARLGFEAIGRLSWIVLPYIFVIIAVASIFAWKDLRFSYLFPILGAGIKPVLIGGVINSAFMNDVLALSIVFQNVKGYNEYKRASLLGLLVAIIGFTWFLIMYIATFDYPAVIIVNFLFHTFTRFIHIGRFFTNIDAFYLIFWVIGSIIRFGVYLYVAAAALAFTFKLKDNRKVLLALAVLSMIIGMIPENFFIETRWREISLYATLVVFSIIPLIMYAVSRMKEGDAS